jgi:hypothetical protein
MPSPDMLTAPGRPAHRSAETAGRLVVAWQHPESRLISPIGFLSYNGHIYRFSYIRHVLDVTDFRPLLGFPDLYRIYESEDLFPLFAQRAMDPRRRDYHRYLTQLGLDEEAGPLEQIARSQGRRQGDSIQLLPEPETSGDELTFLFLVNGTRHVLEPMVLRGRDLHVSNEILENVLAQLRPGDPLALVPQPENPVNDLAIVVTGLSVPLGWVPDLLLEDLHELLERASVTVKVEHVNGSQAPWHLRVLARLHAAPVGSFRFFTGERWASLAGDLAQ